MENEEPLVGLLGAAMLAVWYLAPAIIAGLRGHPSTAAIGVLTLLLGWTGIGWIVALVWSFTGIAPQSVHHVIHRARDEGKAPEASEVAVTSARPRMVRPFAVVFVLLLIGTGTCFGIAKMAPPETFEAPTTASDSEGR